MTALLEYTNLLHNFASSVLIVLILNFFMNLNVALQENVWIYKKIIPEVHPIIPAWFFVPPIIPKIIPA